MNSPVRILLIDDRAEDRALIAAALCEEMRYAEIVEILRQQKFDEVLANESFSLVVPERERAREAEYRNEKKFRDLFESSPDAIFVEDLDGSVLDVNPAVCLRAMYPVTKVLFNSGSMEEPPLPRDEAVFFLRKPSTPAALAKKLREILDENA